MKIVVIIVIIVVMIVVVLPIHVKRVEIKARNRFFKAVGLQHMIHNSKEVPAITLLGTVDKMQKVYTDGVYTVRFHWDDMLRLQMNRGSAPSFTEPMIVFVNGPDGRKEYSVCNLGIPSLMEITEE